MFVLMQFGNKLKDGHPIWQEKISTLEPPISPFETLKPHHLCSKKLGSMIIVSQSQIIISAVMDIYAFLTLLYGILRTSLSG